MIPMQRSMAGPAVLLIISLFAAACGGGGAPSPAAGASADDGGSTATGDATTPTDAPAESGAPAASEAGGGGGGGSALGAAVCDLATSDEVSGVFGVEATTVYDPIAENTCFVKTADDRTLVHWTTTGDGNMMFDALSGAAPRVDGLGDRAAYAEGFGLMIVKDDIMVTIAIPSDAELDAEAAKDAAEQVGAFVAGRM
jgi:hypothetical protein